MDKEEITAEAIRLGTFPISIVRDEDCCTLFTPRHPVTRARKADVEVIERTLAIDEMVERAVAGATREELRYPVRAASPPRVRTSLA
jgi:thiamine biosynthesis protein ThiI